MTSSEVQQPKPKTQHQKFKAAHALSEAGTRKFNNKMAETKKLLQYWENGISVDIIRKESAANEEISDDNEISDDDDHMSDEDFDNDNDADVSRNMVIETETEVESTVEVVATYWLRLGTQLLRLVRKYARGQARCY